MERGLREGMRGIAPAANEDATVALGGSTEATRALPSQPRTRAHQPLQPLAEERPRAAAPWSEPVAERRPAKKRNLAPLFLMLIVLIALVAGFLYLQSQSGGPSTTSFDGGVQTTLDDLRNAISDNTK